MEIRFKETSAVAYLDHMGGDARLAGAAWVCKDLAAIMTREGLKPGSVNGVIDFMMEHRHGTPFEHSALQFVVDAPIFVWREWHRHRIGFSYNEESARYKVLEPVFYLPPRDRPMIKVDGWKPGRPKFKTLDESTFDTHMEADALYDEIIADMKQGYADEYARYLRQLGRKLDPGLARDNLPVGIFSSCWVTCNPRSVMHFLSLRTHYADARFVSYPLYEIEVAAQKVEEIFGRLFPVTYAAFCARGRVAP